MLGYNADEVVRKASITSNVKNDLDNAV